MFPLVLALFLVLSGVAFAQGSGVPVRAVVTVEGHKGDPAPQVTRGDVVVTQDKDRRPLSGWEPVRSAPGGVQFWILIDDGADSGLALQFPELKKFIGDQPSNTRIGVGYMRNGGVITAQDLTSDHDAAAKALRLPIGTPGIASSPYVALEELLKKWPSGDGAREVLMITSGVDPLYGPGPENPYLLHSIEEAQRAGVVVHSIYYSGAGHFGHSLWQITWGQNNLSQLADATGGEMYWQGNINPVSLRPFLDDLETKLASQYIATFTVQHSGKSGLVPVKFSTEVPHATLLGPARVYAAGTK